MLGLGLLYLITDLKKGRGKKRVEGWFGLRNMTLKCSVEAKKVENHWTKPLPVLVMTSQ